MKNIFCSIVILLLSVNLYAQKRSTYPLAIMFNSMCCGVPDSKPLFDAVIYFKRKNKINKKLHYVHIGPLGKEGEYMIAFSLAELTKKQKTAFIKEIKKVVPSMKDKGSASVQENVPAENLN